MVQGDVKDEESSCVACPTQSPDPSVSRLPSNRHKQMSEKGPGTHQTCPQYPPWQPPSPPKPAKHLLSRWQRLSRPLPRAESGLRLRCLTSADGAPGVERRTRKFDTVRGPVESSNHREGQLVVAEEKQGTALRGRQENEPVHATEPTRFRSSRLFDPLERSGNAGPEPSPPARFVAASSTRTDARRRGGGRASRAQCRSWSFRTAGGHTSPLRVRLRPRVHTDVRLGAKQQGTLQPRPCCEIAGGWTDHRWLGRAGTWLEVQTGRVRPAPRVGSDGTKETRSKSRTVSGTACSAEI